MVSRRIGPVKFILLVLLLAAVASSASVVPSRADGTTPPDDAELARLYTPVFYFHPAELFRPQPVDVIVEQARARQSRPAWFDVTIQVQVAASDLLRLGSDERHFLDIWYGDDGGSAYTNYSAHQAYYQALLSPEAGGPPITVYAHVVRDELGRHITIQYWALYYYNDWFNKHEGDWEMVQVMLSGHGEPEWVVVSQHHGGTRRSWSAAPIEDGSHPAVYVARGSHANYFVGDEVYPQSHDLGRTRLDVFDRTGAAGRVIPSVVMLPDRSELEVDPDAWPEAQWLLYRGHWGEHSVQGDFGGPVGPADKGEQWEAPHAWGLDQPIDTDVWYGNRLRVEVIGDDVDQAHIHLTDAGGAALPSAEELAGLAILHADPPDAVVASIAVAPRTVADVVAAWPDPSTDTVTRLHFAGVEFGDSGRAMLELAQGAQAALVVEDVGQGGGDVVLRDPRIETLAATWDAPDLVWVGGILPAHEIGGGVLLALLGSVLPTLGYVVVLYWADRYEREPIRLLATAFVWGAIPSVLLAVVADLFFRLPLDLIGTRALEAARLGVLAPVLQEAVKGAVLAFIAWRYRDEFGGVLDGIVYGATVGFGFAMTGNLIGYLGRFIQWGYGGLSAGVFAEGIVRALNQALYSAILGGGFGLATQKRSPRSRWGLRAGAFVAAAAAHLVHNLLASTVVGFNVLSILITILGVVAAIVAVAWSLGRQRRWMCENLLSEVSQDLYQMMIGRGRRYKVAWEALREDGVAGLRRVRRTHALCAELAFAKSRADMRPDDEPVQARIERLRDELRLLVEDRTG